MISKQVDFCATQYFIPLFRVIPDTSLHDD